MDISFLIILLMQLFHSFRYLAHQPDPLIRRRELLRLNSCLLVRVTLAHPKKEIP